MKKGRSCSSHTSQVEALFQHFGKLVFIVYKVVVARVPEAHTDSARAAIAFDVDLLLLKAFAQTVRILSRDPVFQICFLFCRQLTCRFHSMTAHRRSEIYLRAGGEKRSSLLLSDLQS